MKRISKKNTPNQKSVNKKRQKVSVTRKPMYIRKNLKYLFLVLILFYIGSYLYTEYSGTEVFKNLQNLFYIPTILIGILTLYFDKNKLNEIVNKQFNTNNEKQNFIQKTKGLFFKKELPATSLFILILGISVFTLFHKLDNFDIFSDEVQVTQGAAGYYHTGEYKQWDFIKKELVGKPYNRAKPHQWIIAQSYKLFGINIFAARFPSAFFGVLCIFLFYFIGKYFIKDKYAALIAVLTFATYFEFLFLGRWARMYALVYPIFLIAFYWTFKFITENNSYPLSNSEKYPFFTKYLNFNYTYLPFLFILLYLGFNIHTNIAVIFPVFLVFLFTAIFIFPKEKKYISAFMIASLILVLQILFPYKINFSQFTFFDINNSEIYNKALFGYPFNISINLIFIISFFPSLFYTRNSTFRKKYLILYVTAFVIWLLFSYVIEYAPSYRYISFITPFTVLLIVGSFILAIKILYNKILQTFLIVLLLTSVTISFSNHYKNLYIENTYSPAKPSIAQNKVVRNFHKGDVIFKHWGPKRYLNGIPKDTKFLSLGSYRGKKLSELLNLMKENPQGWLIWHKYNEARLNQNFVSYCNLYFKKYAGYGVDDYGEEIYYYDKKMLQPLELFAYQQYFPAANLSLRNSYSFVFDLKINKKTNGSIFYLLKDSIIDINCFVQNKNLIIKTSENDSLFISLPENQDSRIIWSFNPEQSILFLNGKKLTEKNIILKPDLVKFMINPQFNGYFNNIRLYNIILNNSQINVITKDNKISEELKTDNKTFRTLFLWKKK
ncbi:MAG: glycosyltransferase family 39 protein [Chlorobi bacterium]|nr:glycosyltransferase family 39 protein [Chlorobiota bacterium]